MTLTTVTPSGADGTTLTAANSGAVSVTASGGSAQYKTAAACPGVATGWRITNAASGTGSMRRSIPSTLNYSLRLLSIKTPTVTPDTGDATIARLPCSSGTCLYIRYTTAGNLIAVSANSTVYTLKTAAPLSTAYDLTIVIAINSTTAAAGSLTINGYTPGTTTKLFGPITSSSANLGTLPPIYFDWGPTTAETASYSIDLGGVMYDDGGTTEIGPYSGPINVAPTITGPGSINTTGPTVNLTFQGNDTDGTISSFALVNQSNTANTTVTPTIGTGVVTNPGTDHASVIFPVSGLTANAKYFFGGTDTDDDGATSSTSVATVNVTKDVPDIRSVTLSGFTVVGGGSALDCLLANTPSTRYLESTAPPGGASVTVTFQPATPSSLAKAFAAPVRAKDTSSTETATVSLVMNDTTTIATRGPITLTTTSAAVGGTTTTGAGSETAAITDHSKLSIVVVTN